MAAALLVGLALNGASIEDMFNVVNQYCHSNDFRALWNRMPQYFAWEPEKTMVDGVLGESWIAEEAVASAFYCFQRSPKDFKNVVLTAANTEGDSDSIACIAGSLSGAALGLDNIPREWIANVEDSDYLLALGQRLFDDA